MSLNIQSKPAFGDYGQQYGYGFPQPQQSPYSGYAAPSAYANPYAQQAPQPQAYGWDPSMMQAQQAAPQAYAPAAMPMASPAYGMPQAMPAPQPAMPSFDMSQLPAPSPQPVADQFLRSPSGPSVPSQSPQGSPPVSLDQALAQVSAPTNAAPAATLAMPDAQPSVMTPPTSPDMPAGPKGSPVLKVVKNVALGVLSAVGLYHIFWGRNKSTEPKLTLQPGPSELKHIEFTQDEASGKISGVENFDSPGSVFDNKTVVLKKNKETGQLDKEDVPSFQTAEGKPLHTQLDVYDTTVFDTPEKLLAERKKREEELLKTL